MVALLWGCTDPTPDEQRIRAHLLAMSQAIADGQVRAFMAPVADDFSGQSGQLDRAALERLMRRERMSRQRATVNLIDIRVERIDDARAAAHFHGLITGGSGLIPSDGRWWRIETQWRRNHGDWQLTAASWEPLLGGSGS